MPAFGSRKTRPFERVCVEECDQLIEKSPTFQRDSFVRFGELENDYVSSLQTLGTGLDGELHLLAFLQVLEAFASDRREMDEDIGAAVTFDEAEALGAIEPLNRTDYTFRNFLPPKQIKKIR